MQLEAEEASSVSRVVGGESGVGDDQWHERLYSQAAASREKLEVKRLEAMAAATANSRPLANGSSGGGLVSAAAAEGGEEAVYDRLYKQSNLRGLLAEQQRWQGVVAERLGGKAGSALQPRSARAAAVEAEACDRLYLQAQEQARRHMERVQLQEAAETTTPAFSVPRPVAEAAAARMHSEAMGRMQQRHEAELQTRRDAEAVAAERAHRTAGARPVSAAQRDRLYVEAVERRARLEEQLSERQQQRLDEEMVGATFVPSLRQMS